MVSPAYSWTAVSRFYPWTSWMPWRTNDLLILPPARALPAARASFIWCVLLTRIRTCAHPFLVAADLFAILQLRSRCCEKVSLPTAECCLRYFTCREYALGMEIFRTGREPPSLLRWRLR